MAPTPDGIRVTPENVQEVGQRDELKNYTKEELMMLAETKGETSDSKESKETFVKSLEFEPDTFKIDSTGWKEVTDADKDDPIFGKFVGKEPKVKVNVTWDVVEYLDWPAKGEQIFITYDAFIREVKEDKNCIQEEVETKYLMTVDEFKEKMKDKTWNSEEYKKFFDQEVEWHLAGYCNPYHNKGFWNMGNRSQIWLAGGGNADLGKNKWGLSNYGTGFGFSGRLLKN